MGSANGFYYVTNWLDERRLQSIHKMRVIHLNGLSILNYILNEFNQNEKFKLRK